MDSFRAKFTCEKGKLRIIINTRHRRPVKILSEKCKQVTKEYLKYDTTYEGFDWLENPLRVTDNIEGIYYKPKFFVTATATINPETGQYIHDKQLAGQETVYYIELTDKNRKKIIGDG